jgi:hypothetical protein
MCLHPIYALLTCSQLTAAVPSGHSQMHPIAASVYQVLLRLEGPQKPDVLRAELVQRDGCCSCRPAASGIDGVGDRPLALRAKACCTQQRHSVACRRAPRVDRVQALSPAPRVGTMGYTASTFADGRRRVARAHPRHRRVSRRLRLNLRSLSRSLAQLWRRERRCSAGVALSPHARDV